MQWFSIFLPLNNQPEMALSNFSFFSNQRKYILFVLMLCLFSLLQAQPKKKKDKTPKKPKATTQQIDPATQRQLDLDYVDASMELVNGNPRVAIEHFQKILKNAPEHHASMYNLALLYMEVATGASDYEEAIRLLEASITLDKSNYWYYYSLVDAYRRKGDMANAIRVQELIVKQFPKEMGVLSTLADLYTKNKSYDKALATIKQIEAKQSAMSEEVGMQKYRLFIEIGKYEDAMATINKLIDSHPDKPEFVYHKYTLFCKMNKQAEGVELLKNLLQKFPSDSYALLTLADYYKTQNNFAESDKYLFKAFANPDISVEGKLNVIQSMQRASDKDKEVEKRLAALMQIFTQTHPIHAATYLLKGDLFAMNQNPDSAHAMYRKAIEKEDTKIEIWEKLLESAFRMQDNAILTKDVSEALELFPNNDKFTYYWGMANLAKKEYEQALFAFEKVRKRNRAEPLLTARVHAGIGTVMMKNGGQATADDEFKKAINLAGDDPLVLSYYSLFLANQATNYTKAKEMAEKAVKIAPEVQEAQFALANSLYLLNDFNNAYQAIILATKRGKNADYLELYGDILYKMGKKEDAKKQWQESIALGNTTLNIETKTRQ